MRMPARLSPAVLILCLFAAGCGGSSSETPPPVEPTAADLATWRPPPIPTSSAIPDEEFAPKSSDPDPAAEEPSQPTGPRRRGGGRGRGPQPRGE